MSYLFTSESVSEGHPDKVADQISDALLDQFLAYDDKSRCAIESFVTTGQAVVMGEVSSEAYIDIQTITKKDLLIRLVIPRVNTNLMVTRVVFFLLFTNKVPTSTVELITETKMNKVLVTKE